MAGELGGEPVSRVQPRTQPILLMGSPAKHESKLRMGLDLLMPGSMTHLRCRPGVALVDMTMG